jgi:integrative and conjugative element protein (TIGR02256 family)
MPATCWIRREAYESLVSEARRWPLRETGGALLGYREAEVALVERVLGPGPDAVHGYRHFEPDGRWQQREGERIYADSGRTVAYLGEWHTHPHGGPYPSRQDRETAKMIAGESSFRAPRPLYAIASKRWFALRGRSWSLRMMEFDRGELTEMQVQILDPEASARSGKGF